MSTFESVGKLLILVGVFIVILGVLFTFWSKIPFLGRLPDDIFIERGNFRFFFPIVTSLVISVIFTIIVNLIIILTRR
ncbi:MAG: DUF2905 domain-containing protein [Chloroflexi bacterium]|nr:DUF2905 domain-containing protein [Chloroflexota bacterium]